MMDSLSPKNGAEMAGPPPADKRLVERTAMYWILPWSDVTQETTTHCPSCFLLLVFTCP
jgi:hypothetical protein